jgi:uncharacterized protein (TIGR02145 family)
MGILFSCHPDAAEGNPFANSINYSYDSIIYGGQTYKTVKIGEQVWMAENLNYEAEGSKCYDNSESNCKKYGRLYNWNTAMKACPLGWHLPSKAEWEALGDNAKNLKSKSGWNSNGNGQDTYGFAALPGGNGNSSGNFYNVGNYGYWWSSREYGSSFAYYSSMRYYYEDALWDYNLKTYLCSVRCAQD